MRFAVAIVALSLAIAGCGKSEQSTPPANNPATAKPEPPPIKVPDTRQPTAAARPVGIPPGATSVEIRSALEADKDAEFLFSGVKGATLMTHALTPDGDLDISVYRADTGARLADESPSNPVFFMARLPETLGYLIAVRSAGKATPYSVEIEVPRKLLLDEKTSMGEVSGTLAANGTLAYLVPPGTIAADLTKAPEDAYLTVHGLAGKALLKAAAGARTFTGTAVRPNEEIVVVVQQGAKDGDFTLKVTRK